MRRFAITDIETTGGQPAGNAITEIAVVVTDGYRELDRFHTLLQPNVSIPYYIEKLTGINDDMLVGAPSFADVADELLSIFEDAVFVAHNVGFDYAFVKAAFEHVGIRFNPQRLCTVRIARKLYPGLPSYSLGNLCRHFGVENAQAHRALSDTLATVDLFHTSLANDTGGAIEKMLGSHAAEQWLPPGLPPEKFHMLPESPGVYYLENASGEFLYIGMSGNVKKRIRQHFGGKMQSARRQQFLKEVVNIRVTLTGTEAIAALLEDAEIRKFKPQYNKAQKATVKHYSVEAYEDRSGYTRFTVIQLRNGSSARLFSSIPSAREWLLRRANELEIPLDLCGIQSNRSLPEPAELKERVKTLLNDLQPEAGLKIVSGAGRDRNEQSFIAIRSGQLLGYGYLETHEHLATVEDLEMRLNALPSSEVTPSILNKTIEKEWNRVIHFNE
jgi:DNA polymerase-3 subunit epsilon